VALLRVGQRQQNVSLLTSPAARQPPIASSLRALVGEILPPAPDLAGRAAWGGGHVHIMATGVDLAPAWSGHSEHVQKFRPETMYYNSRRSDYVFGARGCAI
jgi:hypothetical protein